MKIRSGAWSIASSECDPIGYTPCTAERSREPFSRASRKRFANNPSHSMESCSGARLCPSKRSPEFASHLAAVGREESRNSQAQSGNSRLPGDADLVSFEFSEERVSDRSDQKR